LIVESVGCFHLSQFESGCFYNYIDKAGNDLLRRAFVAQLQNLAWQTILDSFYFDQSTTTMLGSTYFVSM